MPHPERAIDEFTSRDGIKFLKILKIYYEENYHQKNFKRS